MKIKIKNKEIGVNFPKKAKVIFVFDDGVIIHGDGIVDAIKNNHKEAVFSATLVKKIPKK